jgi:hypothetical protein
MLDFLRKIIVYPPKVNGGFQFKHQSFNFYNPPSQSSNFFSIQPILSQNFHIAHIFLFFINKEINLGVQKWPDGQRGGYSHLDFF